MESKCEKRERERGRVRTERISEGGGRDRKRER